MPLTISEKTYQPEDVFEAFLFELNSRQRNGWLEIDLRLYEAFHKAYQEFPEIMANYDFKISDGKTVPKGEVLPITLIPIIQMFREIGMIETRNGRTTINQRDITSVKEPLKELRQVAKRICDLI